MKHTLSMAILLLSGNISWLLLLEDKDHAEIDLRRSMVVGADEPSKKSNASKPTFNPDEPLEQTVGTKSLGSFALIS